MLEKSRIFIVSSPVGNSHEWVKRAFTHGDNHMNGKVARIVADKGFGFITGDDGKEYFFHYSESDRPLNQFQTGDVVEFEKAESPKGPRANKVRLV